MIKAIKILPRMAVHSLANDDRYAPSVLASFPENDGIRLISLNGYDEPFLTERQQSILRKKHNFTFINSYRFDDIGGDIWESIVKRKGIDRSKFIEFNDEIANEIKSLIISSYEPFIHWVEVRELLVVHCHAGISRSAAIGSAIAFYLGLDYLNFSQMNTNIDPNKFILAKMLNAFGVSNEQFNEWSNVNS